MEKGNPSPARPRIYGDFNKWSGDGSRWWLILTCRGTFDDLARLNLQLSEGLEVTFYADDGDDNGNPDELEADGHCHFDAEKNYWIGIIDSPARHVSDKKMNSSSDQSKVDS